MEEHSPLYQSYRADGQVMVEHIRSLVPGEEQILVVEVTGREEYESKDVHDGHTSTVEVVNQHVRKEPSIQVPNQNRFTRVESIEVILE